MLSSQRLDVYRCAIQFVAVCYSIAQKSPRGLAALTDQLRRAVISIPLNIAEGNGRSGIADKARFYSIARGSAMESGAILDVLAAAGVADSAAAREASELLVRIVEMLTKMTRVA